jgi:hypothetical protein
MPDTCPRCGSKKVIPDLPLSVEVYTGGGPGGGAADVRVQGNPQAWVFKDTVCGGLTVKVCGECGHAELHVRNFRALYEKYEQTRQS